MTKPVDYEAVTIDALCRTYDEAQYLAHVPLEPGNVTGHRAGVRAVRDAVLDALRNRDFEEYWRQRDEVNRVIDKYAGLIADDLLGGIDDPVNRSVLEGEPK